MFLLSNKLFKNSITYTIANALNKAIPFIMLPILTRYLLPEDYGLVAMYQVLVSILIPMIGMSANGLLGVKFFKLRRKDYSDFLASCIILMFFIFLGVLLLIYIFRIGISEMTSLPENWLWPAALFVFSNSIMSLTLTDWQVRTKALNYSLFQVLYTLFSFITIYVFVVIFHYNWKGYILGQLTVGLIFASFSIILLFNIKIKISAFKIHLISAISFGLPLIPNYVIGTLNSMLGRILVNNLISTTETGLYTVASQISSVLLILASSFNLAYSPWLYGKLTEDNFKIKIKIVRFTYLFFIAIIIIALLMGVTSSLFFPIIVGSKYNQAYPLVIWFSLGFAFNAMHIMVVNYIFFVEKVYWVTMITIPTVFINYFLASYLIGKIGAIGAAQSQALVSFLSFLSIWIISNRVYRMPWFNKKIIIR